MDSLINQLKNQELTMEMVLQQGLARAIVNYPAASNDSPGNLLDRLLEIRTEPEVVSAINKAFQDDLVRRLLLDCLEDATVREVNLHSSDKSQTRESLLEHERDTEHFDT
ncbi:MAG: hypothetical protein PHQ83_11735 [Eubacteriales bacterium]|nr:hypothetical protein [Eubacteriales bacterium]